MDKVIIKTTNVTPQNFLDALNSNTGGLLRILNNDGVEVFVACTKTAFPGDSAIVNPAKFKNEVWVAHSPKRILRLDDISSVLARSPLPQNIQDVNPSARIANNPQLRALGNKSDQMSLVPEEFQIPTYSVPIGVEPSDLKKQIGDWINNNCPAGIVTWVIKSALGYGSNYVMLCRTEEIESTISNIRNSRASASKNESTIIIQPYLEPQVIMEVEGRKVTEIRAFCTLTRKQTATDEFDVRVVLFGRCMPTLKDIAAGIEKYDEWTDISRISVNPSIIQVAKEITLNAAKNSNSNIIFCAPDILFMRDGLKVVEVNLKDPQYPTTSIAPDISHQISRNIADMLMGNREK